MMEAGLSRERLPWERYLKRGEVLFLWGTGVVDRRTFGHKSARVPR
jgi:hypothetical protein